MNRAERRRAKRQGFSDQFIANKTKNDDYERGFDDGIRHTQTAIMMMTAYTLHTHLNLGRKRLPEIMHYIQENIISFETGHLTKADIPAIKEELRELGCEFVGLPS